MPHCFLANQEPRSLLVRCCQDQGDFPALARSVPELSQEPSRVVEQKKEEGKLQDLLFVAVVASPFGPVQTLAQQGFSVVPGSLVSLPRAVERQGLPSSFPPEPRVV
ncbi:MAG TPA: hypothetical protein VEI46_04265 [Thermodesulfovibrionales bacterium]|nr:hypothetical protein [Thermodesulfovibrionales bacterium]